MVESKRKIYVSGAPKRYSFRNISLTNYYNDIRHIDTLTKEEINDLFKIYHNGPKEEKKKAFDKICKHNIKLVVSVAKKYSVSNNDLNDLIQEGNIGLIKAIEKFDENCGVPFYAYAVYWIRREINMYKTYSNPMVVKTNCSKTSIVISEITNSLMQKLERKPTPDEILEEYNKKFPDKPVNKADDVIDVEYVYISELDTSVKENNKSVRNEAEYNDKTDCHNTYLDDIETENNKSEVSKLLKCLSEKEQTVIKLLYGLDGNQEMGVSLIASELGMTDAGVNNIHNRALKKMRESKEDFANSFR